MHPSLSALPLEEKGFVLAALLARTTPAAARERLAKGPAQRCFDALTALAAEPKPVRASAIAALIALVRAPVPAGIERIHPDWLRERFAREPATVVRAVVVGLPPEVARVADEELAARGQAGAPPVTRDPDGLAALRRVIFAGFVPLAGPGAPTGAIARSLLELPAGALPEAIDARGAEALGTSLRRAPGPVVARAAAALGGRLGDLVVGAAAREGTLEAREAARILVANAAAGTPAARVRGIGIGALAAALAAEGQAATIAIAQLLPAAAGRRLLEVAGLSGLL